MMGTVTHLPSSSSSTWGSRSSRTPTEEALLELILEGGPQSSSFEDACRAGAIQLRSEISVFREALLRRGHRYSTHAEQHEETGEALFSLAHELLPDSPAASRGRLRKRLAGRTVGEAACGREALEVLVAGEYAVFDELVLAAGCGSGSLLPLAQRCRDEIVRRGGHVEAEGFLDLVLQLVRELVPDSPAVVESAVRELDTRPGSASEGASTAVCDGWDDEWALEIARQAIRYVAEHAQGVDYEALDLSEAHPAHDDMDAAAQAGDRDAYLDAARRWTRAMRCASERARRE